MNEFFKRVGTAVKTDSGLTQCGRCGAMLTRSGLFLREEDADTCADNADEPIRGVALDPTPCSFVARHLQPSSPRDDERSPIRPRHGVIR